MRVCILSPIEFPVHDENVVCCHSVTRTQVDILRESTVGDVDAVIRLLDRRRIQRESATGTSSDSPDKMGSKKKFKYKQRKSVSRRLSLITTKSKKMLGEYISNAVGAKSVDKRQRSSFQRFVMQQSKKHTLQTPIETLAHRSASALHAAAAYGRVEMVRALLAHPDVNIKDVDDEGNTVLHYACAAGSQQLVRILLMNGANIYSRNKNKQSSLFVAIEHNHGAVVKVLLQEATRDLQSPTQVTSSLWTEKDVYNTSVWGVGVQYESTDALVELFRFANLFHIYHELGTGHVARALYTVIVARKGFLDQSKRSEGTLEGVVVEFVSGCQMPFATAIILYKLLKESDVISNESLRKETMDALENFMVLVLNECRSLQDAVNLFQFYPLEANRVSCQRHIIQAQMKRVINHRLFQMYVDARWLGASSLGVSHAIRTVGAHGDSASFFVLSLFSHYSGISQLWKATLVTLTFGYHYILFLPLTLCLGPVIHGSPTGALKQITGEPTLRNAMTVITTPAVYSDLILTTYVKFVFALWSHCVYVTALLFYTATLDSYNDEIRFGHSLARSHANRLTSWPGMILLVLSTGFLLMDIESIRTMRSKRLNIASIWIWSMRTMYICFWLSVASGFFSSELSSGLFAIGCLAAMLRLAYFGQGHQTLGPLLIVIQEMVARLLGFATIFVLVLMAYWTFDAWTKFASEREVNTFSLDQSQRIFVSLFGEISHSERPLAIYLILGFLGVLLIAMMTDAHSSVKAKAHFEWQYLRAPMVITVEMMPSAPVPFNILCFLVRMVLGVLFRGVRRDHDSVRGTSSAKVADFTSLEQQKKSHLASFSAGHGGGDETDITDKIVSSPAPSGASWTNDVIKDDDEERADVFSRQRDLEAIELMDFLLKQRAEKLESKRIALCMRGEALGIQSALLETLKRLEVQQRTILESLGSKSSVEGVALDTEIEGGTLL